MCAKRSPIEAMILAALTEAARFPTIRSEIDRYIMEDILIAAFSGVEWTSETVEFIGNLKHENKHIRET